MDLTILIPALNEAGNLQSLLPELTRVLGGMAIDSEIVIVDGGSGLDTRAVAARFGARYIHQTSHGYGGALSEGFASAKGEYVVTMDADYSHAPAVIGTLWNHRHDAELVIASRYLAGGSAECGVFRSLLSRLLNGVYRRFLDLPFRDLSSGFRLYRLESLRRVAPMGRDFDFVPEVLVLLHVAGLRIREVPFHYRPRRDGHSRVKLFRFGCSYSKTLLRMMRLGRPRLLMPGLAGNREQRTRGGRLNGLREGSGVH